MGRAFRGWTLLALVYAFSRVENASTTPKSEHLHGDWHPPTAVKFPEAPLAVRGAAVELTFGVVYTIPGFVYKIQVVLQDDDWRSSNVQVREQTFRSKELTDMVTMVFDRFETFGVTVSADINVLDALEGLTEEQALVGRASKKWDGWMVKIFEEEEASEARHSSNNACAAAPGDVDNKHLPIGNNIAILLVGKTKHITQSALHTLKTRVLSRYPNAHVFVHVSPTSGGEAGNESETQHVYRSVVDEHLKALVITPENYGHDNLLLATGLHESVHQDRASLRGRGNEAGKWVETVSESARRQNLQFARLRDAMLQVLREERVLCRRYSHVVRMRTDIIWLENWTSHSDLSTLIPPDSTTLAGDFLDQGPDKRPFSDYFWIASRAIAWAVYVDTWYDINLPMHRDLVYRSVCSDAARGKTKEEEEAAAEKAKACFLAVYGDDIWPEARLKYVFKSRFNLVSICPVCGRYVVQTSLNPFAQVCEKAGENRGGGGGGGGGGKFIQS